MRVQVRMLSLVLVAAAGVASADDAVKPKSDAGAAATPPKDVKPAAKPVATAAAAESSVRSPRSIEEALRILQARRVDVDFKDMPFDDVVSFVAKVGRLNVMASAELLRKGSGTLPAVTLKLRDVSLRQLAEIVAKQANAKMVLRDGVLQFTTPEDARGTPILRVFSIADLTFRIHNFPGPDIQLHTGDVRYVQEEEKDQPQPFEDPQVVVDLLKKFTGEGTWDDDAVSISADGTKLVVKQYPEVLREISAFLAVLRAAK